jgi:hypothetical protein
MLLALACHPSVQTKLRAELLTCPTDTPTMEQLNALPYLEAVVREALRIYTPAAGTQRIAMRDAEIPLQKPFTDKHGVLRSTVRYEWIQRREAEVADSQMLQKGIQRRPCGHPNSTAEPLDGDMGRGRKRIQVRASLVSLTGDLIVGVMQA